MYLNNRVWSMELIGGILHDENTITGLPLLSSPAKKIYYSQWLRTCFFIGVSKYMTLPVIIIKYYGKKPALKSPVKTLCSRSKTLLLCRFHKKVEHDCSVSIVLNGNSPHTSGDHAPPSYEMTPGFKPFAIPYYRKLTLHEINVNR